MSYTLGYTCLLDSTTTLNVNDGGWEMGLWKTSPREDWVNGTRVLVSGKTGVRGCSVCADDREEGIRYVRFLPIGGFL